MGNSGAHPGSVLHIIRVLLQQGLEAGMVEEGVLLVALTPGSGADSEPRDRSQVSIKPGERLPGNDVEWNEVAAVIHCVPLVLRRCTEEVEHWHLRHFVGHSEILAAAHHQHRNRNARHEVERIHLGKGRVVVQPADVRDSSLESRLRRKCDRQHHPSPTMPVVGKPRRVDVRSRFEIVDGPSQILYPLNRQFPFAVRPLARVAVDRSFLVVPIECPFEDRQSDRASMPRYSNTPLPGQ